MKTKHYATRLPILGFLMTLALVACGKKDNQGKVNVQFANATQSAVRGEMEAISPRGLMRAMNLQSETGLLGVTPTIYQIKLVAFYLTEDIDPVTWDNVGGAVRIWTSSKCDEDLHQCGIDPATAGPYVVDYFDLAQGSAAVNEAFKGYTRTSKNDRISAGTYRYLRMDFSGKVTDENANFPNLKFGTTEAHEVRAQDSGFTVKLPEPLVIKDGESFNVDLAYNLENSFYESASYYTMPEEAQTAGKWTCKERGEGVPCIVEAPFYPVITKK